MAIVEALESSSEIESQIKEALWWTGKAVKNGS